MPNRPISFVLVGTLLVCAAACRESSRLAAQEPQPDGRIATLVRRLGAVSFEDRRRAHAELGRLGSVTRPALEEAVRSTDPEIRLRAEALLNHLKLAELWAPSMVRCIVEDVPATDALASLAEQTGNRLFAGSDYGAFHEADLNLDYASAPFWTVLDDICRQSGNRVRHHYDPNRPGLVVVTGDPGKYPVAYAGPVRARVSGASRFFREELDYNALTSEKTHTFQFKLEFMWEDRFHLVAYRSQPELIEAVTETGGRLSATQPAVASWSPVQPSTRRLTMDLRLDPPSTHDTALAVMRLRWGLIAVSDPAVIVLDDLTAARPHVQDDVVLTIEELTQRDDGRYDLTLLVGRDLAIPEPEEVVYRENVVELFDEQGRAIKLQSRSNSLTERGARMKFTCGPLAKESKPAELRFEYPRLRDRRDVEIVFQEVPLPVGQPR